MALNGSAAGSADDWNVPHSGVGCVTRVQVRKSFVDGYEVHQVDGRTILEYWIPVEDLPYLSANIIDMHPKLLAVA